MIVFADTEFVCTVTLLVMMFINTFRTPQRVTSVERPNTGLLMTTILAAVVFAIAFGLRNLYGQGVGDTYAYAYYYENLYSLSFIIQSWNAEWLWEAIITFCHVIGLSSDGYFTVVAILYLFPVVAACYRLAPSNSFLLFTAFAASFVFTAFGANGIRNGVACSLAFWGMTYLITKRSKGDVVKAVILSLSAYFIHHSAALLIVPMFASVYAVKNFRMAIFLWLLAVLLSLTLGNTLAGLVAGLTDDVRAMDYLQAGENNDAMQRFSSSGFRFDFLIYSLLPIVVGYYMVIKNGVATAPYIRLMNTYILSNALWIVFIYAAYSNRFAMLSWFIYPFVLVYPFVKYNYGRSQGTYQKGVLWMQYIITMVLRYI